VTARYLLTITDEDAVRLERWLGSVLIIGPAQLQREGAACFVTGLYPVTDEEYEVIGRRLSSSGPLYHAAGSSGRPEKTAAECDHVFFSGPPEKQPPGTGELCLAGCQTARYAWPDGTIAFTSGGAPA
jgi:hypothetical protein